MGDISFIPAEIMHNILLRLPIKLMMKLKCVSKRWNRVISDPYYLKSWRGDRRILLPFVPVDVLDENDTTRSMVTLKSSPFADPELKGKAITFVGSCNGIVLLVIQGFRNQLPFHDHTDHMVLYNPLTSASKQVPDDLHITCNSNANHVYGFGYGSTPDDLKIVRFRGCEYSSSSSNDNRHTCDVFSPKTNSWSVLKNFIQNTNCLNNVAGTFANGSLHWIANNSNSQGCKIVALDVNNMVLSDIHVPWHGLRLYIRDRWPVLGTLHGCLCIVGQTVIAGGFNVWVMEVKGDVEKREWLREYSLALPLTSDRYSPVSILDDGIVLIFWMTGSSQELVIYEAMKHSQHKVIKISESPDHYFRKSQYGIEYVETLVSPTSLFN